MKVVTIPLEDIQNYKNSLLVSFFFALYKNNKTYKLYSPLKF